MSEDKIVVIGHKNPDTDSICSAIAYAYLKNCESGLEPCEEDYKYEAYKVGTITPETIFALDYFQVGEPNNLENAKGRMVVQVDHNGYEQAVDGLQDAIVVEIVDHHKIGTTITNEPIFFLNRKVGCTATLIYEMFLEKEISIPITIAGLMCSAIISDTLLFRSPTCTDRDKIAGLNLADIAGINVDEYAMAMFRAGSDFNGKNIEEIFSTDYKTFNIGNLEYGVGQISCVDKEELETLTVKLLAYMKERIKNSGENMIFMMMTNIIDEYSDFLCIGKNAYEVSIEAFNIDEVLYDSKDRIYLKGVLSRKKQIIPQLTSVLRKRAMTL